MGSMVKPSKARRSQRSETVRARTRRTPTDRDVRTPSLRARLVTARAVLDDLLADARKLSAELRGL